ncbi:STN domain-containing protein [Herminiimonas glaciei]|uniref:STN domain-containing protein n=1 Tax=Herminiimonas glaciei TaxID=523788 RepID=A0ABW2I8F4_9BURK
MLTTQGGVRAESSAALRPPSLPGNTTSDTGQESGAAIHFSIPRQPLALALDRYGALTGLPIFFDAALVADRMASAVQGLYTPLVALQIMLNDTGLMARHTRTANQDDAFVLRLIDTPSAEPAKAKDSAELQLRIRQYDGLIQMRIRDALCGNKRIVHGDYRIPVRFFVNAAGQIWNPELLASTGEQARDVNILDTLNAVRLERTPPPEIAQPFTMVILPRALAPGVECPAAH